MNTNSILAACFILFCSTPYALCQDKESRTPTQFAKDWAASVLENQSDNILKFYEQSEELDVRFSSGKHHVGIKRLKKMYDADFAEVKFSQSVASKIKSRELGSVAVVSLEHQLQFEIPANKSKFKSHVQTVLVLKKNDGDWVIVNEHSSPISGVPRITPIKD